MKIAHYLYNTFTIEDGDIKIAIDPGVHMKLFNMKSLIPESEWESFTHVFVTHGDPDHYAKADLIAKASDAPLICGSELTKFENNEVQMVHPRKGGIKSWINYEHTYPLNIGELVIIDDITIEAIKTEHGRIFAKMLGMKIEKTPGPDERTGMGAIGYKIEINGKTIMNLGDTLIQSEWEASKPDVLMLPIGGLGNNTWTMDIDDAIEAVKIIQPKLVIPCHYNVPFLIIKNAAPADEHDFKRRVEEHGYECQLMYKGDEISI